MTPTPQEAEMASLRQNVADLTARVRHLEAQALAASPGLGDESDHAGRHHGVWPGSKGSEAVTCEACGEATEEFATAVPCDETASALPQTSHQEEVLGAPDDAPREDEQSEPDSAHADNTFECRDDEAAEASRGAFNVYVHAPPSHHEFEAADAPQGAFNAYLDAPPSPLERPHSSDMAVDEHSLETEVAYQPSPMEYDDQHEPIESEHSNSADDDRSEDQLPLADTAVAALPARSDVLDAVTAEAERERTIEEAAPDEDPFTLVQHRRRSRAARRRSRGAVLDSEVMQYAMDNPVTDARIGLLRDLLARHRERLQQARAAGDFAWEESILWSMSEAESCIQHALQARRETARRTTQ